MVTKIKKKVGINISESFMLGAQTEIETDENLEAAEQFINNTGVKGTIAMIGSKLFGDKVKSNAIKTISKSEQKILESGFEGERKELSTKVAVKLIEGSSLEDDESLQDIWANLLANAVTDRLDVKSSYATILSEISHNDVVFLQVMYDASLRYKTDNGEYDLKKIGFPSKGVNEGIGLSEVQVELVIDNLLRLQLIYTGNGEEEEFQDDTYTLSHMQRGLVCFTYLGYDFVKACIFK